jgi:hypothetical protein
MFHTGTQDMMMMTNELAQCRDKYLAVGDQYFILTIKTNKMI